MFHRFSPARVKTFPTSPREEEEKRKHWQEIHGNAGEQYAEQEREGQREQRAAAQQQQEQAAAASQTAAPVLAFRDDSPAPLPVNAAPPPLPPPASVAPAPPPSPVVQRHAAQRQPTDTTVEEEMTAAAMKIQAHRRGLVERRKYAEVHAYRTQQITKLQAARRGQVARRTLAETLREEAEEQELELQHAAASKIQAVHRGRKDRARHQRRMRAKRRHEEAAATQIAAHYRGSVARREVAQMRLDRAAVETAAVGLAEPPELPQKANARQGGAVSFSPSAKEDDATAPPAQATPGGNAAGGRKRALTYSTSQHRALIASETAKIRIMFEELDTSGNGSLDLDEIRAMGVKLEQKWTEMQLRSIFTEKDLDGSGELSVDEFLEWWLPRAEEIAIMRDLEAMDATAAAAAASPAGKRLAREQKKAAKKQLEDEKKAQKLVDTEAKKQAKDQKKAVEKLRQELSGLTLKALKVGPHAICRCASVLGAYFSRFVVVTGPRKRAGCERRVAR